MPFDLSMEKLLLILLISLLVFGPRKTAELAREAGRWLRTARQTWDRLTREIALDELLAEPAPLPTEPALRCPACGGEGRPGQRFCGTCGRPFENCCPNCATRHVSDKTECALCGTILPAAAVGPARIAAAPPSAVHAIEE